MNSSAPGTPRSAHSPNRELTPSSSGGTGYHVKGPYKPSHTTGESLGTLVGASLTVVNDAIYIFGGFDQYTDEVFNALYRLTQRGDTYHWDRIIYTKGRLPAKRYDHSTTLWNKNKLIIFGGYGEEDGNFLDDIAVLDLTTMTWEHPETSGFRPDGRVRHSATIFNDKLYIAGGLSPHGIFADTLLVLDLVTWEWQPPIPFVRRSQHLSFMYNKRLYLFGGLEEELTRSNHLSFIDVDRHVVTHLEIDSPSAPSLSGQRYAQICGDQLVVAVTLPSASAAVEESMATGLWTLDMTSMQWQYRDTGTIFEGCTWHGFAMAEHDTSFYLFGTGTEEETDDYYSMTLRIDLKEYGIVPVPPPQLGADLVSLLIQQSQSADFSIRSSIDPDAGFIRAHRLVLLARWPHFAHLLSSGMAESLSDTLTLPEPFPVLEAFVRFLYTDTLDDSISLVLTADLLVMANLYLLPRLLALCVRRLHSDMDIESVSKVYHCAGLAGQRGLQQTALHYMFEHFGAVCRTEGFRNLPRDVLLQFFDETPENSALVVYTNGYHRMIEDHEHNGDDDDDDEEEEEEGHFENDGARPNSPMEV